MTKFRTWLMAAGMGTAVMAAPMAADAEPMFSNMFVFGDSLSDTGNVLAATGSVPGPAYDDGRFSNGDIWVETLADDLGLARPEAFFALTGPPAGGVNFAVGGTGTYDANFTPDGSGPLPGLGGQVDHYSTNFGAADNSDALFVVYSGSNDYLLGGQVSGLPDPNPAQSVANIEQALRDLYDDGARTFLVPNLADLGMTPMGTGLDILAPGTSAGLSALTDAHNDLLVLMLTGLAADPDLAGSTFIGPDFHGLLDDIATDPEAYGFDGPVTDPGIATGCLPGTPYSTASPLFTLCDVSSPTATTQVFYDELHPQEQVHALLSATALAAIPEPSTAALLAAGVAGLGAAARRRRAA